jgi:hypothetical protein
VPGYGDPSGLQQQSYDGFSVRHRLDEVGGGSAILRSAAQLAVTILVALVVHAAIVDVRGDGCGAQQQAKSEDGILEDSTLGTVHTWHTSWLTPCGATDAAEGWEAWAHAQRNHPQS